jgi:uncharacterized membrane protein
MTGSISQSTFETAKTGQIVRRLKDNFIVGLVTLAPLGITLWIFVFIVRFFDNAFESMFPASYKPEHLLGVSVPGLGIAFTLIAIIVTGMLMRTMAGRLLQTFGDAFFARVPILRGVYSTTKQMSKLFFSSDPKSNFQKVVFVKFPGHDSKTLGFVTSAHSDSESFVFIPTAPNPTSGYVLVYKNSELERCSLSVEEALQVIVSCGSVTAKAKSP